MSRLKILMEKYVPSQKIVVGMVIQDLMLSRQLNREVLAEVFSVGEKDFVVGFPLKLKGSMLLPASMRKAYRFRYVEEDGSWKFLEDNNGDDK